MALSIEKNSLSIRSRSKTKVMVTKGDIFPCISFSRLSTKHVCLPLILFLIYFSVRLLLVLRGYSFLSSPQQSCHYDLRLRRISIPDVIHYIFVLILQKEPVFPFLMLSAKQANYSYHFYNVFVSYDAFLK